MKQQIPLTISDLDSTKLKVAKVIWYAANLLERTGWTQGAARDEHGNICLLTAILHSLHNLDLIADREVYDGAFAALGRQLGARPDIWNDDPQQTADNVVQNLRRISAKTAAFGI